MIHAAHWVSSEIMDKRQVALFDKTYCGFVVGAAGQPGASRQVVIEDGDGRRLLGVVDRLPGRFGGEFNWGDGGIGASTLARSILADYLGYVPEPAVYYMRFKWDVVAQWPEDEPWQLNGSAIEPWLAQSVPAADLAASWEG